MADLVRVKNLGDRPLRVAYNSKPIVIPAGQEIPMEKEAACVHFGNWELRNFPELSDPELRDARTLEYKRIRTLYGFHELVEDSEGTFQSSVPKVEIYEMDGSKVVTVLEDPKGDTLSVSGSSVTDKDAILQAMRDQMAAMQSQMEELENRPPEVPDVDVPVDSPETAAKRGRPRKPVTTGLTEPANRIT